MMVDCLVQSMVGEKDVRLVAESVAMKGVWRVASKERQRDRLTVEKWVDWKVLAMDSYLVGWMVRRWAALLVGS